MCSRYEALVLYWNAFLMPIFSQHFLKMPAACESVLEDIEDIVSAEDLKPHDRQFVRRNVFPKVRKRNSQKNIQTDDEPPSDR